MRLPSIGAMMLILMLSLACILPHCSCTLEPKFIELGLVPFGFPKAFSVRLENVGATPARFYFVAPPKLRESQDGIMMWDDNQPLCPPWLVISQEEGEVQQGRCGSTWAANDLKHC